MFGTWLGEIWVSSCLMACRRLCLTNSLALAHQEDLDYTQNVRDSLQKTDIMTS